MKTVLISKLMLMVFCLTMSTALINAQEAPPPAPEPVEEPIIDEILQDEHDTPVEPPPPPPPPAPKKPGEADEDGTTKKKRNIELSLDIIKDEDGEVDNDKEKELKNFSTRWSMFDFGFNILMADGKASFDGIYSDLENKPLRSNTFNMHVFKSRVNLAKHKLNLYYGLTFSMMNFQFKEEISLTPDSKDLLSWTPNPDESNDFKKNKLRASYLTVPVLLGVELNPRKTSRSFRLNVGGYAGIKLRSSTKQKTEDYRKLVVVDDYSLNRFRYGLLTQIGFGSVNLFVDYSLSSLFDEDNVMDPVTEVKGPKFNTLTVGLSMIYF